MKIGDLVREKYITERMGIIISIEKDLCQVLMTDGALVLANSWHFWEVINESR